MTFRFGENRHFPVGVDMEMYQGFADAFAEMFPLQIGQVWDSAAAVNLAIIKFSKEVKAIRAEQEELSH